MPKNQKPRVASLVVFAALGLSACGYGKPTDFTVFSPKDQRVRDRYGTFEGTDGITIFGTGDKTQAGLGSPGDPGGGGGSIGVNAYLWRGALQTVSFMPLASADPFTGIIITDWYTPPQTPDQRVKLNILVLDRSLRADAVKVSVFRQTNAGGEWRDAEVDPKTGVELEDKILTKARELRIASAQAS
ncbi:MAG: DUF3576 domain-containing protein [Geminicoccaceae bacterium]